MSTPGDWGLRFDDLAADAGQNYTRTLRRYNELLDRVARRELTAEQVQQQCREYLQEQAASSTRTLVELSVGLLAGLLHVEARYRDALLDGLIPAGTPAPPPPSPDSVDLTNWFQTLATYAAEQSARSIARHQQLVDRIAAGEVSPDRVKQQGERFVEEHAPRFLGDVMNLGMTFVGRLQQSSAAVSDGLYDRVLGSEVRSQAAQPLDPPICIDLRGGSGAVASASIVVENTRSAPAHVVCRVSDFARRTGGSRFSAGLQVEPSRFTLAPGAQQDVAITLPLDPTHFAVGSDYVATLRITGAGDDDLVVQLMAHAESPHAAPETPKIDPVRKRVAPRGRGRTKAPAQRR